MRKSFSAIAGIASRRAGAAAALGAACLGAALALGGPRASEASPAAALDNVALAYNIYVGGVLIGGADLNVDVLGPEYAARSRLITKGVAEWVVSATFDFQSGGAIDPKGAVSPALFQADGTYEKSRLTVAMSYADGAPNVVVADPPFKPRPYQVDPKTQVGALDPIAAIVAAMRPGAPDALCDRRIPVFDGRRRYDFILDGEIDRSDVDDGAVMVECAGRLKRVAGFKPKFMTRPDFTFEVRAVVAADGAVTPQRLVGETPVGTFAISLKKPKRGRAR